MSLFNFLKKKEIEEIKILKEEIESNKTTCSKEIEQLQKKLTRYNAISNIEKEVDHKTMELSAIIEIKRSEILKQETNIETINKEYQASLEIYKKLRKEVSVFESKLNLIEFGIYVPVYDFEKSDDYRTEQNGIVERLKSMIQSDSAAICNTNWRVADSEAQGRAVVSRYKKLMLRAFNGECDVLISKVRWNNINQMKERISKVFTAINKLGEGFNVHINSEYLKLKANELILEYEYQAKKQQEKEAMRAIQEELREEEKARRDFEKAQREAEKEEAYYQKALEKVRKELSQSIGEDRHQLQIKIAKLELELREAQEKKERALSMAQQTKRGHVYIISNIGAFGENVYKIGMTRRLEPIDRVKELGDASVPFQFDIHAMIYSNEARTLEYELHKAFIDRKVNMLNYRKEFFKVTLDEIEKKIEELGFEAEFTLLPEAMEYRETLALIDNLSSEQKLKTINEMIEEEFPDRL